MKPRLRLLILLAVGLAGTVLAWSFLISNHGHDTSMLRGLNNWYVKPLFTVGDTLPSQDNHASPSSYQPIGALDGIGILSLSQERARIFVNHEIDRRGGYSYQLKNGLELTGARVSYFDIDLHNLTIVNSGVAYDQVYDRRGAQVTQTAQINEINHPLWGFSRFCSSHLILRGTYNFADTIYFTHEEATDPGAHPHGGTLWALNVEDRTLHAVPLAGRMSFENTAPIHTDQDHVALLIGDDSRPQSQEPDFWGKSATSTTPPDQIVSPPLWLYIGTKDATPSDLIAFGMDPVPTHRNTFLNRNGLLVGKLFYFVMDDGHRTVSQFHGTGQTRKGRWKEIAVRDTAKASQPGYDPDGYKNGFTLRREAQAGGAFQFSRPEDVSTNPLDGRQAVFASTGYDSVYPDDAWGTVYEIYVDTTTLTGTVRILYDGDDQGGNQFSDSDDGLRNPDNLDWALNGMIYIQEDKAKTQNPGFGIHSREEASIWKLAPKTGNIQRIAQIERTAVGTLDYDAKAAEIGAWESSGVLDVTRVFSQGEGEQVLLATIQAHTVNNPTIQVKKLVEGGQLVLIRNRPF